MAIAHLWERAARPGAFIGERRKGEEAASMRRSEAAVLHRQSAVWLSGLYTTVKPFNV